MKKRQKRWNVNETIKEMVDCDLFPSVAECVVVLSIAWFERIRNVWCCLV
jgi:hypothetical protein